MFKKQAGVLYRYLKYEVIAECFRSDKVRNANFLDVFENEPPCTLIREESLEIYLL